MAFDWSMLTGPGLVKAASNSLFPNPAKGAAGPLNQIPGTITPYYKPYVDAGTNALPGYEDMMKKLMSNPDEFLKQLGSGYTKSPGYDWRANQAQTGVNNAAAAGGMLGTPQHEQQSAEMLQGIAGNDYENYMKHAMDAFGLGEQGSRGLISQGAASSSDLAQALAQVLAGKSGLQYSGQANQNNQTGNLLNGIMSMFAKGGMG